MTRLLQTTTRNAAGTDSIHQLAKSIEAVDQEIAAYLAKVPPESHSRTLFWVWEEDHHLPAGSYGELEVFPGPVEVYRDFVTASA